MGLFAHVSVVAGLDGILPMILLDKNGLLKSIVPNKNFLWKMEWNVPKLWQNGL